jgi:hypothetical protein
MRLLPLILLLLTGCGYRMGIGSITEQYTTFHVSYAKGDEKGAFTSALIEKMSTTTPLRYVNSGADLEITVCLSSVTQRNIDFLYSPKYPKVTTPHEGRLTQTATLTVTDCKKKCELIAKTPIVAALDYDFLSDYGTINQHTFTLGQLEMNPLAKDAATPSLYVILSEKIVDYVCHSW